jgi:hypothetical protein
MIRITNTTHWDTTLIKAILIDAGLSPYTDLKVDVCILTGAYADLVRCEEYGIVRGLTYDFEGTVYIHVGINESIEVLAHELKHAEQYASIGFDTFNQIAKTEIEVTGYEDAWHEVEAREHGTKWLNLTKAA